MTYGHYVIAQHPDGSPWVLGRGGMGMTFKAMDMNLRCPVALKIISPQCFDGARGEHRFLREARLAAQIRHPNVAAIHHLDSQDGEFFYAMEFVDGISADAWVRRRGPMSLDLALDIVMQITRALTAADRLKVVHRDIKPGNIMILPDPANGTRVIAKLIDFGLARSIAGEVSPTATTCGFTGTPQFSSPEQAENLEMDVRSDIYSLGSTFWFFLVGEAPFVGTPARIIAQLLTSEPPWDKVKHLPRRIVRLLRTMLAKDPADRPQTPVALHDQIMACRENLGRKGTRAISATSVVPAPFTWYSLQSFAVAGVLALLLVWLALSPRAHLVEKAPPFVAQTEAAISPSANHAASAVQNIAKPAELEARPVSTPRVQQTPAADSTVPELAPVSVDLENFDTQSDVSSIAQLRPDSGSAVDLRSPDDISFSLARLDSQDQLQAKTASAVQPSEPPQRVSERRHGRQRRSSSAWQSLDKVRGSVQGFLRHIF
jgi:serine/threonine protein kinase